MIALALSAPKKFEFIEQDEPSLLKSGEALVQVYAVGVCGTDVSGYLGKMPFIQYPRILGHELGVEVLAVGDAVKNIKTGDRCSVEPYLNCGSCPTCLLGKTNCCEKLEVIGVHRDGGLRPRIVLPAHKLHPSNDLKYDQLALVETLAIGCHAVDRGAPEVGDNVLIIGAGPIGLSVLEFARLTGANVFVVEPNKGRRDFVKNTYGIKEVHAALEPAAFADLTDGKLAHVVFDATGNAGCMARSFEFAAFGGRVVYVGITTEPVPLNDPLFHRRELTLLASRNAVAADFTRIIGLIREGTINTQAWITHRLKFPEIPQSFPGLLEPGSGVVKAVIEMS
ncbi:MAG: zinc-binding alcohol dehydrogenase family protein [Verrucomicrobia bacterium]|nr:zinc-binding alcohol dehydrogenase family protein [Verrucomicrobiota bacterium]